MVHNIDYTKTDAYLRLMQMGAKENTGKIQKGYGTIRIDYEGFRYIILNNGGLERRPIKPTNASPFRFKHIKDIKDRDAKDYNDAFLYIIDRINKVKRKTTTWLSQMYQVKSIVFNTIFTQSDWIENYSKSIENSFKRRHPGRYDSWMKYSVIRKLHYILKKEGLIKKGRDYE